MGQSSNLFLPRDYKASLYGHNAVKCWHYFHAGRHGSVETRVSHTGEEKRNHRDLNKGRGLGMCQEKAKANW